MDYTTNIKHQSQRQDIPKTEVYKNPSFSIPPISLSNYKLSTAEKELYTNNIENLKCSFCFNIANNPICCQNCQALICMNCFNDCKKFNRNFCCNNCKNLFVEKNLTFNVQNQLNKLKIKCPNKNCFQVVSYGEAKRHLEICNFTELVSECNFCKEKILTNQDHKEIFQHLSKCPLAMILCENCNLFFLRNTFYDHKKYCQKQISNLTMNTNSNTNSSFSQAKTNFQNQKLSSNNNLYYQNSQQIKNPYNDIKNNDLNFNQSNNNKTYKCNNCNENLSPIDPYTNKMAPHFCSRTKPEAQRPSGVYEAQSFYANNVQNQNNFSKLSNHNLANSYNTRTFYGNENQPYLNQFSNQYNNNYIQNNNPNPNYPYSVYNPNSLNSQNTANTNNLQQSHDSYTNKAGIYSDLNLSNTSSSQNINRNGNEMYLPENDRSLLGNNDCFVSIEEFHKHNKSEIKNLVKNKDLEISQIKKDYESKINAIINKNLDQNQKAKNEVVNEDSPLTLNDLAIDTDPEMINPKKSNNVIDSIHEPNFDKDLSMIEYTAFKNELEKLDEKNFSNSQINHISQCKKDMKNSNNNYNKKNNNNKLAIVKKNDHILNDDLDIFEFSHASFENINNMDNEKKKNVETLNKGGRKDKKVSDKMINQNTLVKDNANEVNIEIIKNLHCIEKEKMKKEYEINIEEIKSDYILQMKDLMQTIKEESTNNPKFNKMRYCDEVMSEIKKSVLNKEEEISNYANLQAKYQLLNSEVSAIKENYEKQLDKLNKEVKKLKAKNDEKVSHIKEEKQKETLKVIENNENTILKIKTNYENLISLIRNEKDNEIKKLVSKYENDFIILKNRHENSLEALKKDYKNQLDIIKKNFEIKDTNSKESNEMKIKNIVSVKNKELYNVKNDIFENIHQSFESIGKYLNNYKLNTYINNNNNKKENEKDEFAKFIHNLQNLVEAKINDFILLKEKFTKIGGEEIKEKSDAIKSKGNNISITDISNHNSGKKRNSNSQISNQTNFNNDEVVRKLEQVFVSEEKNNDNDVSGKYENHIPNKLEIKDNKKYFKIIETLENKMHETKKNLDEIIERSLNNTLNDVNKSHILTEENREGGEKESEFAKSHSLKSMSALKQYKNMFNRENPNYTENKILKNVTEKLKVMENMLSEYSNFLEEQSTKEKEKIDMLIAKSQLEIKKINNSVFIDNGKSEYDKKEKIMLIKQKIESEISIINDLHCKKIKEIQKFKNENKDTENDFKQYNYLSLLREQIALKKQIKENYSILKAENEIEGINAFEDYSQAEFRYNDISDKITKIINTFKAEFNSENIKNERLIQTTENLKDLFTQYKSTMNNNLEIRIKFLNDNFEKDKESFINLQKNEITKPKTKKKSLLNTEKVKVNEKTLINNQEQNTNKEKPTKLKTKRKSSLKIAEFESLLEKASQEKKELELHFHDKIKLLNNEKTLALENLERSKDSEIDNIKISYNNEIKLKNNEIQNLINRAENLRSEQIKEIDALKKLHIKSLEDIKMLNYDKLQQKEDELQQSKFLFENQYNSMIKSYEAKIAEIILENQQQLELNGKKFESDILQFKTEFTNKLESLQSIIIQKGREIRLLKTDLEKASADLNTSNLKLLEFESVKNAEIMNMRNQNENDIKNISFSFKQKLENVNADYRKQIENLNFNFNNEKINMQNSYENQIANMQSESYRQKEILQSKFEQDIITMKKQYESEFGKIALNQKNEIKEILEKSFMDISSLQQSYELKLKSLELQLRAKIESLNSENNQIRQTYEKNIEIFDSEKNEIISLLNELINEMDISDNGDNEADVDSEQIVKLKKILVNFKKINFKKLPGKVNGYDKNETLNNKNIEILKEFENELNSKNEEVQRLNIELKKQKEKQDSILKNELDKLQLIYTEEINKLKIEESKNQEIFNNNKNMEIENIKKSMDTYINEERNKIIQEYEEKIQLMNENYQKTLQNSNSQSNTNDEELLIFKESLCKILKSHYEFEYCKLKEHYHFEIEKLKSEKLHEIQTLKKENEVSINTLNDLHLKETNALLGIKEKNSDIADENDFKERVLIDYLKEKFSINCEITEPPSLIPLAYNIIKAIEKNKNNPSLIKTKLNRVIPGYGISFYENGEVYEGEIKNDIPNGFGVIYKIKLQKVFEGFFENGIKNGKGTWIIDENQFYDGEIKNNEFHGEGTLITPAEIYTGDWLANERNGFGKLTFKSGERYEGNFKNELRSGKGILYKTNGEVFDGMWVNDFRKGNGYLVFANGCKLIGVWDDEYNNFNGKFFGNANDLTEYSICKIENEKLLAKNDKQYETNKENIINRNCEKIVQINFKDKQYDVVLKLFI